MTFTAGPGTRTLVYSSSGGATTLGPLTLTGGTITTSTPVIDATQTWNNAATTFTGIRFDVTDTASAAGSLLMDLRVGGSSALSVSKSGVLSLFTIATLENYFSGLGIGAGWSQGVIIRSTGPFRVDGSYFALGSAEDTILRRDTADTLAQRRGVNAQAFRIYNTFTDASNYERGVLQWQSNELQLRVDGAGTGQNRPLQIVVGNQIVAYFSSLGNRSVALGAGAVATNSTSGFVYVSTCAGAPTGVPESYTGRAPIVIDTTNNKLYFYSGGVWRDAGP